MLAVIVRLEERDAQIQLEHDAAHRPHVTRLRPAHLEDHFGRPVVARRDNCTVVLVVERRTPKVDQSHVRALDLAHRPAPAVHERRVVRVHE